MKTSAQIALLDGKRLFPIVFIGFLYLFLFIGNASAQTERWQYIVTDKDGGSRWYLDTVSLKRDGDTFRLWEKRIYQDTSYVISRTLMNCTTKRYVVTEIVPYKPDGTIIKAFTGGTTIQEITPDSIAEAFYFAICRSDLPKNSEKTASRKGISKPNNSEKRKLISREMIVVDERFYDDWELEVTSIKANVRDQPSTNGEVIGIIQRGDIVRLVTKDSIERGWYMIYAGQDSVGWIHGSTIKYANEQDD